MTDERRFDTFAQFYPFYLHEHRHPVSRRLHVIGTSLAVSLLIVMAITKLWWLAALALVQSYAFAWVGHFFFEHNRPATFKYPLYSLMGDWVMWWQTLTGKPGV